MKSQIAVSLTGGDEPAARNILAALAGLHDLGKANPLFAGQLFAQDTASPTLNGVRAQLQSQGFSFDLPHTADQRTLRQSDTEAAILRRHEAVGLFSLEGRWPMGTDQVEDLWSSLVVGGHHGRFHPTLPTSHSVDRAHTKLERLFRDLSAGAWKEQQEQLRELILRTTGVTSAQLHTPPEGTAGSTVVLLTGLVILADWLASEDASVGSGRVLEQSLSPSEEPEKWMAQRRKWFARRIEKTVGIYHDLPDSTAAILGAHAGCPTELQRDAQTVSEGLWIAAIPTGEGKTEAALLRHAARPGEGLIFALPTRATTEALWERISAIFSDSGNAASLVHSFAELNPFYSGESAHSLHHNEWHDRRATRLFAPVSVGTCDQVLLGALRQKGLALRLLALANKHVVLDEVHTYDPYQSALLERLLAWFGDTQTRVTLLSASIPTAQRERFMAAYAGSSAIVEDAYPAHYQATSQGSSVTNVGVRKRYAVAFTLHHSTAENYLEEQAHRVLGYVAATPDARVGVVCNTVDRAVALAQRLAESGTEVVVLHSRMTAAHRSAVGTRIEAAIGLNASRRAPIIVVGTQTIEASLDVDFDHLITDLAPAPSLVQRAGRLWRHSAINDGKWQHRRTNRRGVPTVDVAVIVEEGRLHRMAAVPYQAAEQKRTLQAIRGFPSGLLLVPEGVQNFVNASAIPGTIHQYAPADSTDAAVTEQDELENLLAIQKRLNRAQDVAVRMRKIARRRGLLDDRLSVDTLSEATRQDFQPGEAQTRFVETEKITCLLLDPTGASSWAYSGEIVDALSAASGSAAQRRALLGATLPLSRRDLERFVGSTAYPELTSESGFLAGTLPVVLSSSSEYHDLTGPLLRS